MAMTTEQIITNIKNGYLAGKTAFQTDEDRGEDFDGQMTALVAGIRNEAYLAFRAMYESELDEAMRHVSEMRFNEAVEACAAQGTILIPENPYTVENIKKAKEDHEQND